MSLLGIATFILFLSYLHGCRSEEGCLSTKANCVCSTKLPADTCLLSLANSTCTSGPCNEGYKCDCAGYELCSISKCDSYVAEGGTYVTDRDTTPCTISPRSGTCIVMVDVMDTVRSANGAVVEAAMNNDGVLAAARLMLHFIQDVQELQASINPKLKDLQKMAKLLPGKEIAVTYVDVGEVSHTVDEMAYQVLGSTQIVHSSTETLEMAYSHWHMAKSAYNSQLKKEMELEVAKKREIIDNKMVAELEDEIEAFKLERKQYAKLTNEKALLVRRMKEKIEEEVLLTRSLATEGKEAAAKAQRKIEDLISKAKKAAI